MLSTDLETVKVKLSKTLSINDVDFSTSKKFHICRVGAKNLFSADTIEDARHFAKILDGFIPVVISSFGEIVHIIE